jgi:hypothetical protein
LPKIRHSANRRIFSSLFLGAVFFRPRPRLGEDGDEKVFISIFTHNASSYTIILYLNTVPLAVENILAEN